MSNKKAPKKIYLQNWDAIHPEDITWCTEIINPDPDGAPDAEYIREDLVADLIKVGKEISENNMFKNLLFSTSYKNPNIIWKELLQALEKLEG